MTSLDVRELLPRDREQWEPLWQQYLVFYRHELPAEVTEATWTRLTGDGGQRHPQMGGLAAVGDRGRLLGFAHYVVGPGTWTLREDVYLEDLFVCPDARGAGVGRALVEELAERSRRAGRRKLHWITDEGNATARRLYDAVAARVPFVRYEIDLDAPRGMRDGPTGNPGATSEARRPT